MNVLEAKLCKLHKLQMLAVYDHLLVVTIISRPTHFQELIKQTEGIRIIQVVVSQPVSNFASVTWFNMSLLITANLPVTVTTLSLQPLCSFSSDKALDPAAREKSEGLDPPLVHVNDPNSMCKAKKKHHAYGTVNSKMLLRVCLSSMITAIWMKRSVKQPLGWHCKTSNTSGFTVCHLVPVWKS